MRIAFLGTPDFSVPSLEMLAQSGHELAVFTQPDRPVGRKGVLTPPPVKVFAEARGIPVYQFERIKRPEGVAALRAFSPDLMVTAAFGQLLSKENLDVPKYGCINVHGSLLPKYRGAAPIQWAIVNGETVTGVTTMLTDIGMDTGDILLKAETPIDPNETYGELSNRLSKIGAELLKETIASLEAGTLKRVPQEEASSTKCTMLRKEDGKLDFSQAPGTVHNRVRGLNPWPIAYASLDGVPVKLYRTKCTDLHSQLRVGTLFGDEKQGLFVVCNGGVLEILEIQAAGGKRLDGKTFLRGSRASGKQLT